MRGLSTALGVNLMASWDNHATAVLAIKLTPSAVINR